MPYYTIIKVVINLRLLTHGCQNIYIQYAIVKFMEKKLSFGVEPTMREVPAGQSAEFKLGKVSEWKLVETEWGNKYEFPIVLLSHPSYESISKKGIPMRWQSKSIAAERLYHWMYTDEHIMKVFDTDMSKELNSLWTLTRHEAGGYAIEA